MSPTNLQPVDYTSTQNDAWGFLQEIVNQSGSVIIGGSTGSGKTSLLKALVETIPESNETRTLLFDGQGEDELSSWRDRYKKYVRENPEDERPIGQLIQDELRKDSPQEVDPETTSEQIEQTAELIDAKNKRSTEIMKAVLRQKPRRAIVSEILEDEAADIIEALEKDWTVMTTMHSSSLGTIPKQLTNMMVRAQDFKNSVDTVVHKPTFEKMLRRVTKALDYGIFVDTAYTDDTKTKRLHYIKEVVRYSNGQVVPIFTQTVENGEVTLIKESGFNAFMKSLDV